ncbi:MAG: MBL fold metallo-hydrolase [Lutibacter sp.]|jgi:phosphoribosyl 1,2-cyclic phosphodiesterase
MNLKILGSSSRGNSYILESEKDILILDAGVSIATIKKAVNFDLSNVVGCLWTHQHQDHSKSILDLSKAGINCYSSQDAVMALTDYYNHHLLIVQPGKIYQIGSFKILPFEVKHDVTNYGFLIDHHESGKIIYITDTYYVPYKFKGLNNILIEANYSIDIANEAISNGAPVAVRNRVLHSHMEISTVVDFLKANDLKEVNNIVLLHMSSGNSNAAEFKKKIQETAPGKIVTVADKNMTINLSKISF